MTAKVRCAICYQQFNSGSAAERAAQFNRHQCNTLPPVSEQQITPRAVTIAAVMLVALMFTNWLGLLIAGAGWFTPIAVFTVIIVAGVAVYKLTEKGPQ
jgi:hypothetical protein